MRITIGFFILLCTSCGQRPIAGESLHESNLRASVKRIAVVSYDVVSGQSQEVSVAGFSKLLIVLVKKGQMCKVTYGESLSAAPAQWLKGDFNWLNIVNLPTDDIDNFQEFASFDIQFAALSGEPFFTPDPGSGTTDRVVFSAPWSTSRGFWTDVHGEVLRFRRFGKEQTGFPLSWRLIGRAARDELSFPLPGPQLWDMNPYVMEINSCDTLQIHLYGIPQ